MLRLFEKITQAFPSEEPNQPPKGLIAFCLHYSRGMITPLVVMSLLTAAIAVAEVSLFSFLGTLVDWLVAHDKETFISEQAESLILMGGVVLILLPTLVLFHSLLVHQTLLGNYPMSIRWFAHRYLLKQSLSFYQDDFAGRIGTKVMQTSLAVRESVMKVMDIFVYISVYFVAMIVAVLQADFTLAIPLCIWLVIYVGILSFFFPRLRNISEKQADARSIMTGRVVDSYTNIATVKLFSHSQREVEYARESMNGFLETVYSQMRWVTGLVLSVQCINYLLIFTIAFIGISLWLSDAITAGAIAVAMPLALRLNGMSQWVMWEMSALFENLGTVSDGINTLSKPLSIVDQPQAKPLDVPQGEIRFEDIRFHYGKGSGVIEHLNLTIKPGEKIGLVGRSGAGKSTLMNLLLRFYDVEGGKILIDGQNISAVQQESLRQKIGVVTQDTSLLHRTVRENILYGRPSATEEEMLKATQQAEADEFIKTLTDPKGNVGYDAQVGERGVKLSGGQRQRVAIARVLLKDAPILILDEATSALDSEVEAAIQQSLNTLMEGKTVIAIAHRLSTIASMDRLIVLDQGQIVEQGTHQELVNKGGIYAELWAHQSGGFIGSGNDRDNDGGHRGENPETLTEAS